ncbi:MAG TPA: hypothetical protein VGG66_10030 [Rhizomicrobium sp.]|jgi:hypothetical protein
MPRKAIIVFLMLSHSPALAGTLLPAGKPAGVRHAQEAANGAVAIGALAIIAIGGFVISSHPYKLPGATASTSTQP